jgi:hypothetical protein
VTVAVATFASLEDFAASPYSEDDEDQPIGMTDKRLLRASDDIRELLIVAEFDIDTDGKPTVAAVREAIRNATCAQAAWGVLTGDASGAGAAAGPISLGPLSLGSRSTASTQSGIAAGRFSPEAVRCLRTAGLIPNGPLHG